MESKEYAEGREAYEEGLDLDQNPYEENTAEYDSWERGYRYAETTAESDTEPKDVTRAEMVRLREEQSKRDEEKRQRERPVKRNRTVQVESQDPQEIETGQRVVAETVLEKPVEHVLPLPNNPTENTLVRKRK